MAISLTPQQTIIDSDLNSHVINNDDILDIVTYGTIGKVYLKGQVAPADDTGADKIAFIQVTATNAATYLTAWSAYIVSLAILKQDQDAAALAQASNVPQVVAVAMVSNAASPVFTPKASIIVLNVTGVLSAGGALTLPANIVAGQLFLVNNLTTGSYALTVSGTADAGSGIAVGTSASNDAALLQWTGTKIQRVSANAASTS